MARDGNLMAAVSLQARITSREEALYASCNKRASAAKASRDCSQCDANRSECCSSRAQARDGPAEAVVHLLLTNFLQQRKITAANKTANETCTGPSRALDSAYFGDIGTQRTVL